MNKWESNKGLVSGPAGLRHRGLQRHHPPDDRGQLLGPGHLRPGPALLRGPPGVVQGTWSSRHPLHDALWRQFLFSGLVLLIEMPLGILIALAMPTPRLGWTGPQPGHPGPAPAHPLERDRHHLDHLHPARHRPVRLRPSTTWGWLSTTRQPSGRLGHRDVHGGLALDAAGGPAGLCRARSIPEAYYQAARIDGASAWATFRYIQLPKMRGF